MFSRYRFFDTKLILVITVIFIVTGLLLIEYPRLNDSDKFTLKQSKLSTSIVYTSTQRALLPSLNKHVTKSLSELGAVPELSGHVLFFNRVPKTGSEMLVLLMQWLQGQNNFRHIRLKGGKKRHLTRVEQEMFVDEVYEFIKREAVPITFDRHLHFINFTSFDKQSPTFINLIRDPVEKFISRFYYHQVTPDPNNIDLLYAPKPQHGVTKYLKTFEECIVAGDPECHLINGKSYDLAIPYFCGQDPRCMILNDYWALQAAKKNVERYFSVVGVLEELNSTLEVLEDKLPYFFKGVKNIYFNELLQPHNNKNRKKPKTVNDDVLKYLKECLLTEYEFYQWVRARLFGHLQMISPHH